MAVDTSVVDKKPGVLEKDVAFDEEEAYFELCEIISMAQQTGNYTKFQNDLNEWKKRYPIDSFSDKYKSKIRYLLSEEFLDSILKDYLAFLQYSKLDPNKQLDKFRKIFYRAEQHKDPKKLDADLKAFYKEYPLSYLKEKFPHIVAKLTSNSYRDKILQKFDSSQAYTEFEKVVYDSKGYSSLSDLENALKPLREQYPLADFNDEYRDKVENLLKEDSLKKALETTSLASLDMAALSSGTVISLETGRALSHTSGMFNQKTAYFELLEIMKNPNNFNSVFDWAYKYMRYIGRFDDYHKGLIISTLVPYYKIPKQHDYRIPIMDSKSHGYLSFGEYQSIDDIKKDTILQYIAILSTTGDLTNDDIERLEIIHDNSLKAQAVDTISEAVDLFTEKPDNTLKLTLSDPEYFTPKDTSSTVAVPPETDEVINDDVIASSAVQIADYIVDNNGIISTTTDGDTSTSSSTTSSGGGTSNYTISVDVAQSDTEIEIEVEKDSSEKPTSSQLDNTTIIQKSDSEKDDSKGDTKTSTAKAKNDDTANVSNRNSKKKKRFSFLISNDYELKKNSIENTTSNSSELENSIDTNASSTISYTIDEHNEEGTDTNPETPNVQPSPEQDIIRDFGTVIKPQDDFDREL